MASTMCLEEESAATTTLADTNIQDKMFNLEQSNARLQNQVTGLMNLLYEV